MTVKDLLRVVEYQQLEAGLPIPKKKAELVAAILELKERGPLTGTQIYGRKVMAGGEPAAQAWAVDASGRRVEKTRPVRSASHLVKCPVGGRHLVVEAWEKRRDPSRENCRDPRRDPRREKRRDPGREKRMIVRQRPTSLLLLLRIAQWRFPEPRQAGEARAGACDQGAGEDCARCGGPCAVKGG